jgi:hypothetical protein
MNPKQYTKSFEKYIQNLILPEYPEIVSFDINYTHTNESRDRLYHYVEVVFYLDVYKESLETDLYDEIEEMKEYFAANDFLIHTIFREIS